MACLDKFGYSKNRINTITEATLPIATCHKAQAGKPRQTYGHSMAISPWGEVLADLGTDTGIALVDLDPASVAQSRKRIAALGHDRPFEGP